METLVSYGYQKLPQPKKKVTTKQRNCNKLKTHNKTKTHNKIKLKIQNNRKRSQQHKEFATQHYRKLTTKANTHSKIKNSQQKLTSNKHLTAT